MDPDALGERLHRIYSNIYIYIYIAMYTRFEHQVWKVFII